MRKLCFLALTLAVSAMAWADNRQVASPDGRLVVNVSVENGRAAYTVSYDGQQVLAPSALGMKTNLGDFTQNLSLAEASESSVTKDYVMTRTKRSKIHYDARTLTLRLNTEKKIPLTVYFQVSNNDVAFRYQLGRGPKDNPKCPLMHARSSVRKLHP